jgi:hypothetical protein
MEMIAHLCDDTPFATVGSSAAGVCIEVPFGEAASTLIWCRPQVSHPWLGSGLSVTTSLRPPGPQQQMATVARSIQESQIETVEGGERLGAWGVREIVGNEDFVAWSRFVPNLLFRQGYATDVAWGEINRAVWVDRLLFPHLPPRDAWKVMRANAAARGHLEA